MTSWAHVKIGSTVATHSGSCCGDSSSCDANHVDVAGGVLANPVLVIIIMLATVAGGALATCSPHCIAGPKLGVPTFCAIIA
eukprot:654003-Pyramimonas_sp.AAC.1